MNKESFIQEFIESFPSEWKVLKKQYALLKIRRILLITTALFLVIAIAFYFSSLEYSFELSVIPGILAIGAFYFSFFQINKPAFINHKISSISIPLLIHLNTWNIEYEFKAKPHLKEFRASRLYPYTLSNLNGKHFFSGIAKKLPFIAWFVEAEYVDKVGESALSMVTSRSAFNGFTGIQIMVKNLTPHLNGVIVVQKSEDEDLKELDKYYKAEVKWKNLQTDDNDLKRQYNFYTPVENPQNILDQLIVNKITRIKSLSQKPFAFSIRRNHIYLNQYWENDFVSIDMKKDLDENIYLMNNRIKELINLSFSLGLPS